MLFNSYEFLFLFLPITLLIYWSVPSSTGRKWVSWFASYVFYGAWSLKFAGLMLVTTSVDYFMAQRIADARETQQRKRLLVVSLLMNLGVLGVFKYYDFFASNVNSMMGGAGWLPLLHVALPIGISFYIFESMSYTIDVYRGKVTALRRFVDYGHFVTMFPRLVAGPIARYVDVAEQLKSIPRSLPREHLVEAIHFFSIGLAKKLLLADPLSTKIVAPLFAAPETLSAPTAWVAALAYTVQLYLDFSGYSDMAVGLGLLLGFRLPRNFSLPYAAQNIAEFWRKWHISLSTWLRDYLYIPLGGNRNGKVRTAINLFITMVLGGLWHGANWTFVIWGAYHGAALLLYNTELLGKGRWPRPFAVLITFLTVVVGWVMFRAASLQDALHIYQAMLGLKGFAFSFASLGGKRAVALLVVGLAIGFCVDTYEINRPTRARWAIVYAVAFLLCLSLMTAPSPFLYFQF